MVLIESLCPHCQSFFPALQSHSFAMQLPSFLSISSTVLFVPMRPSTWLDSTSTCMVAWYCGRMEAPCSLFRDSSVFLCQLLVCYRLSLLNNFQSCYQFLSYQLCVSMLHPDKLWHDALFKNSSVSLCQSLVCLSAALHVGFPCRIICDHVTNSSS